MVAALRSAHLALATLAVCLLAGILPGAADDIAAAAVASDDAVQVNATTSRAYGYGTPPLYLYAWCAQTDMAACTNDFVAVIDATPTSATFGTITKLVDAPWCGVEPHHAGLSADGNYFVGGGLIAFLKGLPDMAVFDTRDAAHPRYSHNISGIRIRVTDEFLAIPSRLGGGFVVTQMGTAAGGSPGGVAVLNRRMKLVGEFPRNADRPSAKIAEANPHGVDVDWISGKMLTTDFLEVTSAVSGPFVFRSTARIWDFKRMKVERVVQVPEAIGSMDARFSGRRGLFFLNNGVGEWFTLDAFTGTLRRSYCLVGNEADWSTCATAFTFCMSSPVFARGTRMFIASYSSNEIRLLDVSDPWRMKTIQTYAMTPLGGASQVGPHVIKICEKRGIMAVSTYFVTIPGTLMDFRGEQGVRLFTFTRNSFREVATLDMKTALAGSKGNSKCHGMAFNSPRRPC